MKLLPGNSGLALGVTGDGWKPGREPHKPCQSERHERRLQAETRRQQRRRQHEARYAAQMEARHRYPHRSRSLRAWKPPGATQTQTQNTSLCSEKMKFPPMPITSPILHIIQNPRILCRDPRDDSFPSENE